jgi:hypothetical protein
MNKVRMCCDMTLGEMVPIIVNQVRDRGRISDFILALDEAVGDIEFTTTLRDRLNSVIADEIPPQDRGKS